MNFTFTSRRVDDLPHQAQHLNSKSIKFLTIYAARERGGEKKVGSFGQTNKKRLGIAVSFHTFGADGRSPDPSLWLILHSR